MRQNMRQNTRKLTRKERILRIIAPKRFDRYWIDKLNAESRAEEQAERKRKIRLLEEAGPEGINTELHEATLVSSDGWELTVRRWVVTVQGQTITSFPVRGSKPSERYLYDLLLDGLKAGII